MNDMKKNIRRVFWLYFVMFLTVVLYLGKFILVDSADMVNSTYNPRLNRNDFSIKRGNIYDVNGVLLAESVFNGEEYARRYYNGSDFAHTIGFIHNTKSGVEAKYNFNLNKLDFEIFQRAKNLVTGEPLQGDNVTLTIDSRMQALAAESLSGIKGGIVAMEPDTGRIIAMASSPAFDTDDIAAQWDNLAADEINSPLLNRSAQGLYPPGSIFKVITADAIIENMEDYESFYYECKGSANFGDDRIRCFDSKAHGTVNLHDAIKYSCNTYFASAAMEIGYDKLIASAEKAMFNQAYPFDLEYVESRFQTADNVTTSEIIQTSIGQGKTLTTPLHMAMITSAIANGGVMVEPYVCEEITSFTGRVKHTGSTKNIGRIFSAETCEQLKIMMTSVVEGGTGAPSKVEGITMAGKTGTAENASGDDHGWFIVMAPVEEPEIVLAIVTENTGGSKKSLSIAKTLVSEYFKLKAAEPAK